MRIRLGIVLISLAFLASCAVVEPLTGGDRDENAPVPNLAEMQPPNASTNFSGKQISIPFDEFFSLNNPTENIIVIPPDIKPKAKIKNKTLVLSWEEEMKPNTTYAFYLNGVVQDLTEKNDSLMSFVFSTGPTIDSLTATYEVRDAFSQNPLSGQTVGLYTSFSDSVLPNYFGKTDRDGKVTLHYMKRGQYDVLAFGDDNKNLKSEVIESLGFKLQKLDLTTSFVDSTPILVSPPKDLPKITTLKLLPPSTFILASNRSLESAKYFLNGELLSDEHIVFFEKDSVLLPFQWTDSANYELIVETASWSDTSGFRMQNKDKNVDLKLAIEKDDGVFANEPIRFFSNHLITSLDVPSIELRNPKDSTIIPIRRINYLGAKIEIDFVRSDDIKAVEVVFQPMAVQSPTGSNADSLSYKVNVLSEREVGSLKVILEGFETALILDLLSKGKLVQRIPLKKGNESHTFTNLLPGEYSFRLTIDENENGMWDGGDWLERTPPEKVNVYLKSNRVRGNWDTEIILQKDGI